MIKDQMFSQMNQAALSRLKDRDPREIARNAGIRYDEMTKVLIFTWISNVSLSAGGRYRVQPKGTIVYVAFGAPDSVEIMKLMRENGGEGVGTFDTEMATYVAWALKE